MARVDDDDPDVIRACPKCAHGVGRIDPRQVDLVPASEHARDLVEQIGVLGHDGDPAGSGPGHATRPRHRAIELDHADGFLDERGRSR
ncbi:MAG: hypothetical protein WAN22_15235, partial [Solirubrobacteraceae bacterium]